MAGQVNIVYGTEIIKVHRGITRINKMLADQNKKMIAGTKKNAKALKDAGGSIKGKDTFMSDQWFSGRLVWFAKLRAFWGIYRQLAEAVVGAFQFEQEMANVRAITQATNDQFEQLRQKALEVGTTTRFSSAEAAKGMVVMSQAGLSVVEILESITNVANLATATLFDFERTTSLVVTIMRAWNLTSKDTREITDTLATAINSTKLNMEALVAGFNFVSGIAPQMNLNLQETTALLGTLANRGLSASTAATSLRAVMAALLNPTDKFRRVLKDVGLTVDDVNPQVHEFTTILKTLKDAGFGASEAFRAFRRRAAAGAAILISSAEEVDQLSHAMIENGRAAQMAAINLNTVSGQWKQFQDQMIANADTIFRDIEPAIIVVINAMKELLSVTFKLVVPMTKLFSVMASGWRKIAVLATRGPEGLITQDAVSAVFELTSQLKDADDTILRTVNSARRLEELQKKINAEARDAVMSEELGKQTDEMDRAIKIANQNKLITFQQAKAIKELSTDRQKQVVLEGLVGDEVERQTKLLARTLNQQKVIKEVTEKGRLDIVKERTRATWDEFAATDAVFQKEQRIADNAKANFEEAKRLKKSDPEAYKFSGLSVSKARGISDRKTTIADAALERRNDRLTEFFDIVKASGPLADKIMKDLGVDSERFVEAILIAPNVAAVDKTIKDIADAAASGKTVTKEMVAALKEAVGVIGEVKSKHIETHGEAIKRLKDTNALLAVEIKQLKQEEKALSDSANTEKERIAIMNTVTAKEQERNQNLIKIQKHGIEDTKNKIKSLVLDNKILDATNKRWAANLKLKTVLQAIAELKLDSEFRIKQMQKINQLLDLRGRKQIDILKSEKEIMKIRLRHIDDALKILEPKRGLVKANKQIVALERERALLTSNITINTEKQKLATDAIARNLKKYNENALKFDDMQEFFHTEGGVIDTVIGSTQGAGETALSDMVNVWAEQRAEVKGLEAELAGLNEQYQKALSEGNIEKARELEKTMGKLRGRIDDLSSPLKNLANSFKTFARTVIEELQKVIIKMIIVKIIGTIIGMFGPSGTGGSIAQSGGGTMSVQAFQEFGGHNLPRAHGGLIPGGTFANFRKFASGGVTGGAGMALLGDNPSGKELVIPSENISDDKVSGHTRDSKTPINIVNVLTEQDIAKAMQGLEGQRTIINTIGRDIGKRGPTYRAIKA